ncbi:hypothetical protein CBR_g39315 [Chara braunii]|uniref:Uncharacterized protein n=1 Tax=Chara braunii TaxID=69332 RepID=A0A388K142_CHABU|nr:hypothetical protein CBR_g39315 [Chara braunii]|eukprot:GBG63771.1 hypothetical protein CBR_g39315 [Chara braunii]
MVELRSGKSTIPYTQAQKEQAAAVLKERKEKEAKRELIRQAKKMALLKGQTTKKKKLEEEMERLQKEEEKLKAVDEEEIEVGEEKEESLINRSTKEKGEPSGTKEDSWTYSGLRPQDRFWVETTGPILCLRAGPILCLRPGLFLVIDKGPEDFWCQQMCRRQEERLLVVSRTVAWCESRDELAVLSTTASWCASRMDSSYFAGLLLGVRAGAVLRLVRDCCWEWTRLRRVSVSSGRRALLDPETLFRCLT